MKLDTFLSDNLVERKDWNMIRLELPANLVERSTGNPINPKARATIYQLAAQIFTRCLPLADTRALIAGTRILH